LLCSFAAFPCRSFIDRLSVRWARGCDDSCVVWITRSWVNIICPHMRIICEIVIPYNSDAICFLFLLKLYKCLRTRYITAVIWSTLLF
jgi:hypothetical protein